MTQITGTNGYDYIMGGSAVKTITHFPVGVQDYYFQTNNPVSHLNVYRESERTPNFKRLKGSQLPVNPFYFVRLEKVYNHGFYKYVSRYWFINGQSGLGEYNVGVIAAPWNNIYDTSGCIVCDDVLLDRIESKAVTKALLKLKDQKVNLAQVYGERHQTVRLFEQTAQRFINAGRALRNGSLKLAAKALGVQATVKRVKNYKRSFNKNPSNAISEGWLELQYGWLPLLDDIYGSIDVIKNGAVDFGRQRVVTTTHYENKWETNHPRFNTRVNEQKVDIKYVISYSMPQPEIQSLAALGITNPSAVLWELTPWSFAIDWLLPIGNWINSWDAAAGLSFVRGSKTVFEKYQRHESSHGHYLDDYGDYYIDVTESLDKTDKMIRCKRTPLASFPMDRLPAFKNPFSRQHIANLSTLLVTTFRNRPPKK